MCREVRLDAATGKQFCFFADPDDLPLELYQRSLPYGDESWFGENHFPPPYRRAVLLHEDSIYCNLHAAAESYRSAFFSLLAHDVHGFDQSPLRIVTIKRPAEQTT